MGASAESIVREAYERIGRRESAQDLLAPHFEMVGALTSGPARTYDGPAAAQLLRDQHARLRLLRTVALADDRVYVELAIALDADGTPETRAGHLVAGISTVRAGLITSSHLSIDVPGVRAEAGVAD